MKRHVYVPFKFLKNGDIPQEAISLAKDTGLSIRLGQEGDSDESDIHVMQVPERNGIDFRKTIKSNFVQPIDYTNEFVIFPSDLKCEVTRNATFGQAEKFILKPVLLESHIVKYRARFAETGIYDFIISTDRHGILSEGKFEVL